MSGIDQPDELRALRLRAYGPDADILDPEAFRRLRELEGRSAPHIEASADAMDSAQPQPRPSPVEELPEAGVQDKSAKHPFRASRSAVLIVLGVLALAAVVASALILVQRTQVDPLQGGARQIARLSADPSYNVPNVVSVLGQGADSHGFESFHGMRAAVSKGVSPDACLSVYSPAGVVDDNSFKGTIYSACAAGGFPAAVQFRVDSSVPKALRSAFPQDTALQFIYDQHDNQIVVYVDRKSRR